MDQAFVSTMPSSHTMRKTYRYRVRCPIIKRNYGQSVTEMTEVDMECGYNPFIFRGVSIPFYKLEKMINDNALESMTKIKQYYHGKHIEYSVPISYIEEPKLTENTYPIFEETEYESSLMHQKYDTSMIYIMNDTSEFYKLRPKHEKLRQFAETDTTQIMYGVINPETKYTTLFKNPVFGQKNMITFDFGSYKQITHIETFGRYPKWTTSNQYMKTNNISISRHIKKQIRDIGICISAEPYCYVKKYEVQYRNIQGKWESLGIFDGNQDISTSRLHQLDVYTRYLRVIPIDFRGKIPSMEILIYGKQAEEKDISKSDTSVIKYTVFVNTKVVPDGFGRIKNDFPGYYSSQKKYSHKLTTKQYLNEYL